jgi:hypothetical protein
VGVVGTRIGLWLGVQLGLAGLLVLVGAAATAGQALDEAAGWWMVDAALVDQDRRLVRPGGGGCCRSWPPGGSSTPAAPSPWPWA